MLRLGILLVAVLAIIIVCAVIDRQIVRPARKLRHTRELEAENARLDALLQPRTEKKEVR
jgi:hypothetical protein